MRKLVFLLLFGYVVCRIAEETGWKRAKPARKSQPDNPFPSGNDGSAASRRSP